MPNNTDNRVILQHDDTQMIDMIYNIMNTEDTPLCQTLIPMDESLLDGEGWYDWRIENWGTKWDVRGDIEESDENSITLFFESAWSPPLVFYKTLFEDYGFEFTAYYYEPGTGFCGKFETSDDRLLDEYYDIQNNLEWVDLEWVKENIPEDIDDEMGISSDIEAMEEWEDDE